MEGIGAIIVGLIVIIVVRVLISIVFDGLSKFSGKTIVNRRTGAIIAKPYNDDDRILEQIKIDKQKI